MYVLFFNLQQLSLALSLFCLCTLVAYIANNMDPDQTAISGFIVFACVIKLVWSAFDNRLYAADVKSRQHFLDK